MSMIKRLLRIGILGIFVIVGFCAPAFAAADRHANYYYPTPSAIEEIESDARRLAQANRRMRIGFVVGMVTKC